MTIIFKAKTREGYSVKILGELLQNNIQTACFEIDQTGIRLRMMDHHTTILLDMELLSDRFSVYKFKKEEKMFIGINLTHFHKMLKSIKKRDSIELFINDDNPTELGIKVIPKENNRVTISSVKIQTIQTLDIDLPVGYGKPVIVPSGEFQKMCKGLAHLSKETRVTSRGFMIKFFSDAGGVMKRQTVLGEMDDSDSDSEEEEDLPEYDETFSTDQLSHITKIAGLNTSMQIFPKTNEPLLFRTQIGSLGLISIYIKPKSLQNNESQGFDSDDDY